LSDKTKMLRNITLSEYVKRRNGVPLGASGSMKNMLRRSFGAGYFYLFWQYWNPIWGYYLSRYVMKPVSQFFPRWFAIICTFAVSGAIHDLAVSLVKWQLIIFFTPWFILMGIMVVISYKFKISYSLYDKRIRMTINLMIIVSNLILTRLFLHLWEF